MSIIGPRPAGLSETDLIEARERYGANAVTPGLTGLAQVNGRDVLARDVEKKAQFDGLYAKKITFWGDVKIFFKTIGQVFRHKDVVEGTAVMEVDAGEPAAGEEQGEVPQEDVVQNEIVPTEATSE